MIVPLLSSVLLSIAMITATVQDIRFHTIPNAVYVLLLAGGVCSLVPLSLSAIAERLLFALLIGLAMLFVAVKTDQLGGGDVKMIACLALYYTPIVTLYALMAACCIALIYCLGYRKIKKAKLQSFAFAPFLTVVYAVVTAFI